MARLFKLEVHTPHRLFFSGEVECFTATLADGEIGVYAGRSPFTAPLKTCGLKIKGSDGVWKEAAVTTGIVEVTRSGAIVLASSAEWPEEIDRERTEDAKKRAEERLEETMLKFEADRARSSFERASNRLAVLDRADKRA
jgi:F-type H+-transporting ATPase subunit epsilon